MHKDKTAQQIAQEMCKYIDLKTIPPSTQGAPNQPQGEQGNPQDPGAPGTGNQNAGQAPVSETETGPPPVPDVEGRGGPGYKVAQKRDPAGKSLDQNLNEIFENADIEKLSKEF